MESTMDAAEQSTQEGRRTDLAALPSLVGASLGHTAWSEMTQQMVDAFAELTGDHNFIHVDVARAEATPFGGTITQRLRVSDAALSINYGLERVRFPAPLAVGARFRGAATIDEVTQIEGGAQVKLAANVEVDGQPKPALVAECLLRFYT